MQRVPNPFSRPSAAPENPEVLALDEFRRPGASVATPSTTVAASSSSSLPEVVPKPLPAPELEEKKIRVSVKLTAAEHWELKKRIAQSNMGVDEYLRALLFPHCCEKEVQRGSGAQGGAAS
jgi:hypothetical protein